MLDALYTQFHALPEKIRDAVSSAEALSVLEEIEEKYDILLAKFVMKVMIREIPIESIGSRLIQDYHKDPDEAVRIARELIDRFFKPVLGFLTAHKRRVEEIKKPQYIQPTRASSEKKLEQMTPSQVPLSSRTVSPAFIPSQSFQQQAHIPERSPIVPSARDVTQRMGVDILPNTSKQMEPTQDITAFTQELIRMYQLPVQTQDQLRRFYNLIVSRMKGIRDEQELHDMLISPWNLGGMDFTTGLVQQVQSSIQKQAAFLQQMTDEQSETYEKNGQEKIVFAHGDAASVNIRTEQPTKIARPVFEKPIHDIPAPQVATPTTTLEEQRGQDARQAQTTSIYTNPLQQGWQYTTKVEYKKDAPSRTPVILPTESKEIESQSKPQVVSAPVPQEVVKPKPLEATTIPKIMPAQKIFPTVRKSLLPDSKPKLSDIRMRPTPMGPLEELQSFSVKDLRQLSQDPKQVTQLLQGKLDLLEEESLEAKSKGINAWKRSVLNQLYIEMGQESLVSGESIENIMQKRAEQKRPYLTVEEFEAIADFNTSLRF